MRPSNRLNGAFRFGTRLCAVFGLVVLLVTFTPIDSWWIRLLAGEAYRGSGDVLIVLGGTTYGDGTLTECSYLRSVHAVRSYRAGGFQMVIVSGGTGYPEPTALAIRDLMQSQGVPAQSISVETASLSTRENAMNLRPLVEKLTGKKVLLTSDYHMFRARRVFLKQGLHVLPLPVPDVEKQVGTWSGRWSAFLILGAETCKIAYYYVHGWL